MKTVEEGSDLCETESDHVEDDILLQGGINTEL
jgi:hypothetical protein